MLGHDPMSLAGVRSEQAVESNEVAARAGGEGGESSDEVQ